MGVGLQKTNRHRERERERERCHLQKLGRTRRQEQIQGENRQQRMQHTSTHPQKNMKVPPPNCTIELNKVLEMMEKQLS
jgi:hypothetical protein